jgi:hypothetical protein
MKFDQWILRILPIAIAGAILAVHLRHQASPGGTSRAAAARGSRVGAILQQGDEKLVGVAYFSSDGGFDSLMQTSRHITEVLEEAGITCLIGGSRGYEVSVSEQHAERAISILKRDKAKWKYDFIMVGDELDKSQER